MSAQRTFNVSPNFRVGSSSLSQGTAVSPDVLQRFDAVDLLSLAFFAAVLLYVGQLAVALLLLVRMFLKLRQVEE